MKSHRIFVEKYSEFRVEAESLRNEFNENLSLGLRTLRLLNVYDLFGFSDDLLEKCRYTVFGEVVTDSVTDTCPLEGKKYLAVECIPGQFDQRASSAVDCVHLIDPRADVQIKSSRLLIFDDDTTPAQIEAVKHYYINAVESREKDLSKLALSDKVDVKPLADMSGFTSMGPEDYPAFCREWGLAMSREDLGEVVNYFKKEGRNPTETELRILDTYWSDHCRHTTFTTKLESITIDESFIKKEMEDELEDFYRIRESLGRSEKPLCLMELATIGARYLKSKGLLEDLEQSEENNACSIFVDVDVDSHTERWLLQFKNETHNHPTEIEPFGGASTCLGGAVRDPLSGRAYVYQAMRVTGAADITAPISETLAGKLPQRVISRKAAAGYSSYGNQLGLATTHVREIFHEGYKAKRLEVGAVVGAVKADRVRRESPEAGDVILLLGGRTGRDGIGGATGSSKEHTEASIETCGSEVQKGNAPEERKLQRLFRRPEVTRLIKKSNDFGAGGVSVAIGELAPGLDIYLDRVPVKYSGLNPTELAISESQERMAVVVPAPARQEFESYCESENVEVTYVADVTSRGRMRMFYKGETVCDISREFIDSAGAPHYASACIGAVEKKDIFDLNPEGDSLKEKMLSVMKLPNVASQKGLVEMFDSTIGRSTVLMPYGGATQQTPTQVSVQKLPCDGFTDTASILTFGFDPRVSSWSPYHGAAYAVIDACTKAVSAGADYSSMRFSYQEYFERMTSDPHTWGLPLSALLGALKMQTSLGLPSIGGKDSMSGTFEHINVPPTLIAFGVTTLKASRTISPELKWEGNRLYLVRHTPLDNYMPNTEQLKRNWKFVTERIGSGDIVSAWAVGNGGVAEALANMSFGNRFGVNVKLDEKSLFSSLYGSLVVESTCQLDFETAELLGEVTSGEDGYLHINSERVSIDSLLEANNAPYRAVYPQKSEPESLKIRQFPKDESNTPTLVYPGEPVQTPIVYIPVFPGTNCDYDTAKAFRSAGAEVRFGVFRNLTPQAVLDSIDDMARNLDSCHILALCGGFSAGDEPDGSGKFIANTLCNKTVSAAIDRLIARGGLILGICNGFQALVKSGLLPYGKTGSVTTGSPTLFRNDINRHISCMVSTRVASTRSPWLKGMEVGDVHSIAVSHGEGKFVVSAEVARQLFENSQVAFQYVDPLEETPTMESPYNPNGSSYAIEGIISPNGQILGKMGHSERFEDGVFRNIPEERYQPLFENAVRYFRKK